MKPDPQTGLIAFHDLGSKTPEKPIKAWPIDWTETSARNFTLKDGSPRFVLAEDYVAPVPV